METPTKTPAHKKHQKMSAPSFRGFTLQLFLILVLPLTALVLAVAFGSQSLHHEAMRSLVGDRDLKTVRAAASSLESDISHISGTIQILSRSLNGNSDFHSLLLTPDEISTILDGGLALFSYDGRLIRSSSSTINWSALPSQIPDSFDVGKGSDVPKFSALTKPGADQKSFVFISAVTAQKEILIGAFSPNLIIEESIGNLVSSGQTTVVVIIPANIPGEYDVLYQGGQSQGDESMSAHPGIEEVLRGESGINYFQSSEGEHVVAYSPVKSIGWGIVIEEAWEDIANPFLVNTQAAPLILAPVFLLALLAIWFGARSIVTPLQKLEKQAANLAAGDFKAINQPVGGIEEIQNLQFELIEMAEKLKTAQQTLRNYIGAITAGIESERKNLARELHDDTIQTLIALNQRIQLALLTTSKAQINSMSELQALVQQAMVNLRRLIRGLRPIYLEDLGLVASLEMLIRETEQSSNILIVFTSKGQEQRINQKVELSIYRMVQESINNVINHANAMHAWVELDFSDNRLNVTIRDDGIGFEVPKNPAEFPEIGHFGLLGLSERADLIHAELVIKSKLGEGTTILIKTQNLDAP